MANGKSARAKALRTLERALDHVRSRAPAEWVPRVEMRAELLRMALRRISSGLFRQAGVTLPADAALFRMSAPVRELEARIQDDVELSGELDAAAEGFVGLRFVGELDLPHALGAAFEELETLVLEHESGESRLSPSMRRKRSGTFYTPASLAREVAEHALSELAEIRNLSRDLWVCDPACGAGAFLVELGRGLLERRRRLAATEGFDEVAERRRLVEGALSGIDLDPLALEVAELSLFSLVLDPDFSAARIRGLNAGDSLSGRGFGTRARLSGRHSGVDWSTHFANRKEHGFDLVIGNPPWVAFAGRAAQPLGRERRAFYAAAYAAFRGYPTLHAAFVERAVELAPHGVIALVVPSPLSDLDGYRSARRVVTRGHVPAEPLLEFGGDAFDGVTQPCFALVARPCLEGELSAGSDRPFRLSERSRKGIEARSIEPPAALARLFEAERLPPELFGEMGLQTTKPVTERLLLRAAAPQAPFTYPLLEGREVREFRVGAPRLFLNPDSDVLRSARCRLRPVEEYQRVRFVVRQTAKFPIAALHTGEPFRNTLLAGFQLPGYSAELLVGLLNSSLFRALHLAARRDARQSVFPQVKIGHLRALPRPPRDAPRSLHGVAELAVELSRPAAPPELSRALDDRVFDLFGFEKGERADVLAFLRERAPELFTTRAREVSNSVEPGQG